MLTCLDVNLSMNTNSASTKTQNPLRCSTHITLTYSHFVVEICEQQLPDETDCAVEHLTDPTAVHGLATPAAGQYKQQQ